MVRWPVLVMALALIAACQAGEGNPAVQAAATTMVPAGESAATATASTTLAVTTSPATTAPATTAPATTVPSVPTADMLNPAVTQATINTTVCVSGFTGTIRPPVSFTDPLKVHQIITYGYVDRNTAHYEEDHVIALEVGGAPAMAANLFPEPRQLATADDQLENQLHGDVCQGRLTLAQAQQQLLAAKVAHGYQRAASIA